MMEIDCEMKWRKKQTKLIRRDQFWKTEVKRLQGGKTYELKLSGR